MGKNQEVSYVCDRCGKQVNELADDTRNSMLHSDVQDMRECKDAWKAAALEREKVSGGMHKVDALRVAALYAKAEELDGE